MATGCKSRAPKGPTTTHSPPVARRGLPILQIPAFPDKAPLARGEDTLYRFPLLVFQRGAALAAQRTRLQRVDDYLRTPPHTPRQNFREN